MHVWFPSLSQKHSESSEQITLKKIRLFFFSSFDDGSDGSVCCDSVADVTCEASNFTAATDDGAFCESSGGDDIAAVAGGSGAVFLLTFRFPDMLNAQLNCADKH